MRIALLLAMTLCGPGSLAAEGGFQTAPAYSAASIVNSATNLSGSLAPNTIVSLYGEHLSYATKALSAGEISNGRLPTVLAGTGVRVLIANMPAYIYFVSPGQVNLLIPNNLRPGRVGLRLVRDGLAGPEVFITLTAAAPALFQSGPETVIALKADYQLATPESPVRPGEIIMLYATGLGETIPNPPPGAISSGAAPLARLEELGVLFDGRPVARNRIAYAGAAPGFAGLYQINVWVPADSGDDPEIQVRVGDAISPPGVRVPVRRE